MSFSKIFLIEWLLVTMWKFAFNVALLKLQVMEISRQPSRVSVPELLNELQVTKMELENIKVNATKSTKVIHNLSLTCSS